MAGNKDKIKTRRYQIRKFVTASSVTEALRLEKQTEVEGIWAEKTPPPQVQTELIGFRMPNDDDDDE